MNCELTLAQQRVVEDNLGLVGKVIRDKVHGLGLSTIYSYDDLFQIGCIGLCKAAATDKGGTFSTYAYRIIWNEICDVLIRSTRIGSHEISLEMVSSSGTEPSLELSLEKLELEDLLSSAVKDAPLAVRKGLLALSLTAQGHKSHEIGQMLQVQSGTVRTWMSKARRFLREQPELEELAG